MMGLCQDGWLQPAWMSRFPSDGVFRQPLPSSESLIECVEKRWAAYPTARELSGDLVVGSFRRS